jgi:hypothetical protein
MGTATRASRRSETATSGPRVLSARRGRQEQRGAQRSRPWRKAPCHAYLTARGGEWRRDVLVVDGQGHKSSAALGDRDRSRQRIVLRSWTGEATRAARRSEIATCGSRARTVGTISGDKSIAALGRPRHEDLANRQLVLVRGRQEQRGARRPRRSGRAAVLVGLCQLPAPRDDEGAVAEVVHRALCSLRRERVRPVAWFAGVLTEAVEVVR